VASPRRRLQHNPRLVTDYDVHGMVGVRLVDATPREVAAVDRQLGPVKAAAELDRDPDIVIRFVDRVEASKPVRLLGAAEAGFTEDAFLVLRSKHKSRTRVRFDLEQVGQPGFEIVCDRGIPAVPLLTATINLTVLGKGVALPLHGAAFTYNGTGVVVTGWSKGGKTESVLAFTARGAKFVGDEWVYLTADGEHVHGLPEPMRLWDWQLRQLPDVRRRIGADDRRRLAALRAASRAGGRRTPPRVANLLAKQQHADVAPETLFGELSPSGRFERLFFASSWERPETEVRPIDPLDVADRMAFSLRFERAPLQAHYEMFRFAFPDRVNPLLEGAPELEQELLRKVFSGKPAFMVDHPYPVDLAELFAAMSAHC
jgi:hypothetical protein